MKKILLTGILVGTGLINSTTLAVQCHNIKFKVDAPVSSASVQLATRGPNRKPFEMATKNSSRKICIRDGDIFIVSGVVPKGRFVNKAIKGKTNLIATKPGTVTCFLTKDKNNMGSQISGKVNCSYKSSSLGSRTCYPLIIKNKAGRLLRFVFLKKDTGINFSVNSRDKISKCIPKTKLRFKGRWGSGLKENVIQIKKSGKIECDAPGFSAFKCRYI